MTEKRDVSFDRREGLREAVEEDTLHGTSWAGNPSMTDGQNLLLACSPLSFGERAAEGCKME